MENNPNIEQEVVEPVLDVTDDDKLFSLLSYVFAPIVPLVLMFIEEKFSRPFVKYHVIQSLIFGGLVTVISFITSFFIIGICLGLVGWGFSIYFGIQAYNGEMFEIPVITKFAKDQGWL